jgi:hypothetical protein
MWSVFFGCGFPVCVFLVPGGFVVDCEPRYSLRLHRVLLGWLAAAYVPQLGL